MVWPEKPTSLTDIPQSRSRCALAYVQKIDLDYPEIAHEVCFFVEDNHVELEDITKGDLVQERAVGNLLVDLACRVSVDVRLRQ